MLQKRSGQPQRKVTAKRVRSEKETAEYVGISIPTLRRLAGERKGPRRVKLSPRRNGYLDVDDWLNKLGSA